MMTTFPQAVLLLLCFTLGAVENPASDGAYVLRVEAPFASTAPAWLPLRVSVQVTGGKPVAAFATAQQLNVTWHEVDVSDVQFSENRFTGALGLRLRRDDIQQSDAERAIANPKPNWRYSDGFMGFTSQTLRISCPVGTVTGAAPGEASWDKDLLGRTPPGTAKARAWRETVADDQQTRHVELFLLRWTDTAKGGSYDAMYGSASLLLRGVLTNGQAPKLIALQATERYQMQFADLLWQVPESALQVDGASVRGSAVLVPNEELRGKLMPTFHPLPAKPVRMSLEGRLIGNTLAGTAKIQHEDKTVESMFLGQVRPFAHALHADRTPRTWNYASEPDPALVEAAQREAAIPIRPGVSGERPFWSDVVRFGGYDRFVVDGKTVVQFDGGPKRELLVLPEEEYRAKLKEQIFDSIAAPTFDLKTVPGAVKYRIVIRHERKTHDPVAAFEHVMEAPSPSASLGSLWDKIPVHSGKHDCSPYRLIVSGLDAQGQVVGSVQTVSFRKKAAFDGPYHKLPRSYRDAALLSARWMRDNPRNTFARLGIGEPGISGAGGDGQLWYTTFSALYAALVVHQLSPDPVERADALEQAVVSGDLWLRSMACNYLPDTYKGWVFDQWIYGTGWLDLYRLTGDGRYRDAVLEHARRLVAKQLPSGTWPDVEASNGHTMVDPQSGRPFIQSIQGPSMQQWDPSSALYYLGRIRKELNLDEFKPAEDRTCQWIVDNSLARMEWRKQGPHASEDHKMPWTVLPDCALHFFHYLALDLPGRSPDWNVMADLLRWSEDRVVDWRRTVFVPGKVAPIIPPFQVKPSIDYIKNRDVQLRLAHAYAMLAQKTGNPLHRAKAEALAGSMLVAQFPTTGQIPHVPTIDTQFQTGAGYAGPGSGDGGNKGEYATMALLALSQLMETK